MLVSADKKTAVTAAVPAVDTILRVDDDATVVEAPRRIHMMHAQTPQTVYLGTWRKVYRKLSEADREFRTDVSGMYLSAGLCVKVVDGARGNIKITTPEDLEAARKRVAQEANGEEKDNEEKE